MNLIGLPRILTSEDNDETSTELQLRFGELTNSVLTGPDRFYDLKQIIFTHSVYLETIKRA